MRAAKRILDFLSHPVAIILGLVIGFIIGIYFKKVAIAIAPFGRMYLAFLNMCILPIIITAIISGLAKIIRTPEIGKRFPKIVTGFVVLLAVPSIVGVVTAVVSQPGKDLNEANMRALGGMMIEEVHAVHGNPANIIDFIVGIVPWNFFDSVSRGHIMSVVFACIFIGLGTGFVKSKSADYLLDVIDAVSDVFNLLFKCAVYFLPIGILCVIADQMKSVSLAIFGILVNYIVIIYLTMGLLIFLYIVIMWRMVGGSFWKCLKAMKAPLFLAFSVNNTFIAIKSCLDCLDEELGLDRKIASLIVPFGMVANRQGKIFVFSFTALFLAQLYGADLGITGYGAVIIGSSLAGMAAPGHGPMLVPSMAVVLSAIHVPTALVFVIFTINSSIVDRTLAALTVQGNCLLASLSVRGLNKQIK